MSHRVLAACVVLLSLNLLPGCTKDPEGTPDGGTTVSDGGSDPDGGTDGGLPADGKCKVDDHCKANEYCRVATGECLPAKPCRVNAETGKGLDSDCHYQDVGESDYCDFDSCYCDPLRNGGTCRPRVARCKPCSRDIECGTDAIDYEGACVEFAGAKVCLPKKPNCMGYITTAGKDYCVPPSGSCTDEGLCSSDADCDPMGGRPICDTSRGRCVPVCTFNFQTGESSCPPGQVCHVDPRLLTASNPNYGGGKCGKPCDSGDAPHTCQSDGDKVTACEADGDKLLLSTRPLRCRPPAPKCVRDADCPADPATNSHGYCDFGSQTCKTGCKRTSDCDAGFKCVQNACVKQTCIESGGANIACNQGEFCCGEQGGPDPCPTGVDVGQCYQAPNPPWCAECADGAPIATPAGAKRPQKSRCEGGVQWHSCDPLTRSMCPQNFKCEPFLQFCKDDAECGPGGKCGDIQTDAGTFKGCVCNGGEKCPSPSTCGKDQDGNPNVCMANWCSLANCPAP